MIRRRLKENQKLTDKDYWRICALLDWDFEEGDNDNDNGYKALDELLENGLITKEEHDYVKNRFDRAIEIIEEDKEEYFEDNFEEDDYEDYDYPYASTLADSLIEDLETYDTNSIYGDYFENLRDVHKVLNDIVENGFEVTKASEEDGYASVAIMPNSDTYKSITNRPIWIYSPMEDYEEEGFLWDWDEDIFYMDSSLDRFFYEFQRSPEIDKFWGTIDYDQDKILDKLGR